MNSSFKSEKVRKKVAVDTLETERKKIPNLIELSPSKSPF